MRGHILEPIEVKVFDPPADVDRLVHAPALIDVAHEVHIRPDRFADQLGPLHLAGGCRLARQRELHLHLSKAFRNKQRRRLYDMIQRVSPQERAARVSGNALAEPAEQGRQGLAERLALDIPKRHVDGREGERRDPARTGPTPGRITELLSDGFNTKRIVSDDHRAKLVDRELQRGGERRSEKTNTDPFDPGVRLYPQGDKLVKRPVERRSAGKRLLGRQLHNL